MVYFFWRGAAHLTLETRLNPDGPGYQLVISADSKTRIESFAAMSELLARDRELVHAWRAQGWHETANPLRQVAASGRNRARPGPSPTATRGVSRRWTTSRNPGGEWFAPESAAPDSSEPETPEW